MEGFQKELPLKTATSARIWNMFDQGTKIDFGTYSPQILERSSGLIRIPIVFRLQCAQNGLVSRLHTQLVAICEVLEKPLGAGRLQRSQRNVVTFARTVTI